MQKIGFLGLPDATAEVQTMFDEDIAERGYVMNVSRLWAYQPATVAGLFRLLAQLNSEQRLSLRQRSILVTACASAFGDSYCTLAWGSKLAKASDAQTAAAVVGGVDDGLSRSERSMAAWARKVARDPNGTTAADVQALRAAGFSDSQIFTITVFVALRLAFSTVNDALGLRPDAALRSTAPAIARPGVVQLHRWGLLPAVLASGAPAIRQVTFTAAGESVTREVKDKAGVDLLLAPRRYILDTIVAEAPDQAGVHMRLGGTVVGVRLDDAGRAVGVYGRDRTGAPIQIDARFVVGADGLGSTVARAVGAEIIEHRGDNGAVQYAYYGGISWHGIELIVADRALAGVFPTHHGQACVWVGTPSADARAARRRAASRTEAFTTQLQLAAPELAARLPTGQLSSSVTGMLRLPNQLRRAHGPGWALVGDAGYHRDAVTGYGLSDAYRDAELLAAALHEALRGDADEGTALAGYQRRRDNALHEVFELTCALAAYPPVPEFVELQKQLSKAIDVEAAELEDLPVPDASVDVVISNGVINLCPDKARVFREAARVLKPGGRLAIADIVATRPLPEPVTRNADLWAACIGGAAAEVDYRAAIDAAGLKLRTVRDVPNYEFLTDQARNASITYGVRAITLAANRP